MSHRRQQPDRYGSGSGADLDQVEDGHYHHHNDDDRCLQNDTQPVVYIDKSAVCIDTSSPTQHCNGGASTNAHYHHHHQNKSPCAQETQTVTQHESCAQVPTVTHHAPCAQVPTVTTHHPYPTHGATGKPAPKHRYHAPKPAPPSAFGHPHHQHQSVCSSEAPSVIIIGPQPADVKCGDGSGWHTRPCGVECHPCGEAGCRPPNKCAGAFMCRPCGGKYCRLRPPKKVLSEGCKGRAGTSGNRGLIGKTGYDGDCGTQGKRGEEGEEGDRGDRGRGGTLGRDGAPGDPGHFGPHGTRANQGTFGPKGQEGPAGDKGDDGDVGDVGDDGKPGPVAQQGARGKAGTQGAEGGRGKTGFRGLTGEDGDSGPAGDRGEGGTQGEHGREGDKGDRGNGGTQGEDGVQGKYGGVGPDGFRGKKGGDGDSGPAGFMGMQGDKGSDGKGGKTGFQGPVNNDLLGELGRLIERAQTLRTIAADCNVWVMVGQFAEPSSPNTIAGSRDGMTWTGQGASIFSATLTPPTATAIAFGDGMWLAGGEGRVAHAADGETWTVHPAGVALGFVLGLAYSTPNNLWVAAGPAASGGGPGDTMLYSTDEAATWILATGDTTNHGRGAAFGGTSQWVAVGGEAGNTHSIITSTDGQVWTGRGTTVFAERGYGVATNGSGTWVAVGSSDASSANTLAISTVGNAALWTGLGTNIFSARGNAVAHNPIGQRWVAVGAGSAHNAAWSDDGMVWHGLGLTMFGGGSGTDVAHNGFGLWVATGSSSTAESTYFSADGKNWSLATPHLIDTVNAVAFRRQLP